MDWIIEPERKIPVVADVDLLVCGGGIAGVAAVICAARYGVKVTLLEKYGFLGGLVTASLVITTPPPKWKAKKSGASSWRIKPADRQ